MRALETCEIARIRRIYGQTHSYAETARETGYSYNTVSMYAKEEDFNVDPPVTASKMPARTSILDPFKGKIEEYLEEDRKFGTSKQYHTGTRIFERLRDEEGYEGSVRTVTKYVAKIRHAGKTPAKGQYVPLVHHPGEAQGDFGENEFFIVSGKKTPGTHFALSFPQSNARFIQVKYGMNHECLAESLRDIFEYIGGVPREIWLDNASTMVATMGKTVDDRIMTDRFARFSLHYGFEAHFCNGAAGNEKGGVERSVGYSRKNLLVPVPRFTDIAVFNRGLLKSCDKKNRLPHYRKKVPICGLFEEDRKALLPLPTIPFDTALYTEARTDKCGRFTFDSPNHLYSASPEVASSSVRLKVTSCSVTVMDQENKVITVHPRLYSRKESPEPKESMDWLPYLNLIARKPRAWKNSGFAELVPEDLRKYMEGLRNTDLGKAIKMIAKITEEKGFDKAVRTVREALCHGASGPESLEKAYSRLCPDKAGGSAGNAGRFSADVSQYDKLLDKE